MLEVVKVEFRSRTSKSGIFRIYKYGRMSTHSRAGSEGRSMGYVRSRNSEFELRFDISGIFEEFEYGRMSSHSKADNEGGSMGYVRSRNSEFELRIRDFRDL